MIFKPSRNALNNPNKIVLAQRRGQQDMEKRVPAL
jgi:hypothetical protein